LLGIAREASLKMLELSAGKVDCYFESPLGFRHGPKLIVDNNTLVIILNSCDSHCKKYDDDLIAEIRRDRRTTHIFELAQLTNTASVDISDVWLTLPYIVICQVLAFEKSLELENTPDNPCPTGEANRVVQGVTIYPFQS